MNIRQKTAQAIAFGLYMPLGIGHYLVTGGHPILPEWLQKYHDKVIRFADKVAGPGGTYPNGF